MSDKNIEGHKKASPSKQREFSSSSHKTSGKAIVPKKPKIARHIDQNEIRLTESSAESCHESHYEEVPKDDEETNLVRLK